jgi:catechol 2,3-dioxygenase-like lactoylglutathione lyase family enzyme
MPTTMTITAKPAATRLHHNAYVAKNLEDTRRFYEDVIGLPLVATWCEKDVLFGKERTYAHCFFALEDGSALAFFQFADPSDQAEFGPPMPASPFHHIALNVDAKSLEGLKQRVADAGVKDTYILEHGYCHSLYVKDPNGLIVEFTLDDEKAPEWNRKRKADAHSELQRWLAGDHTPNNQPNNA